MLLAPSQVSLKGLSVKTVYHPAGSLPSLNSQENVFLLLQGTGQELLVSPLIILTTVHLSETQILSWKLAGISPTPGQILPCCRIQRYTSSTRNSLHTSRLQHWGRQIHLASWHHFFLGGGEGDKRKPVSQLNPTWKADEKGTCPASIPISLQTKFEHTPMCPSLLAANEQGYLPEQEFCVTPKHARSFVYQGGLPVKQNDFFKWHISSFFKCKRSKRRHPFHFSVKLV